MEVPQVSVVMINYNGLPWLEPAMASVLASVGVSFELIVVDDASKDASREVIRRLADGEPRVTPVFPKENQGISSARNAGIRAARGEFVSLIDSDDLFFPHTLATQRETFLRLEAEYPGLSLLASDAWIINEKGERKGRYISPDWWDREGAGDVPLWTLPSTFFFRRAGAVDFFVPYRSADAPLFVRRMEAKGPVGFTGEPLIEYRLRMTSVTNHRGAEMVREMKAAEKSRLDGRLDNPWLPGEIPPPNRHEVATWVHGRNAKNAAVNGKPFSAARETLLAMLADPARTMSKIARSWRSLRS
jgi:glycosyltransferase involved in cell wall biosynthesis